MRYEDLAQETFTSLNANKTRSGLTILGIVIGISSVIALVSIGQGATSSIQSSIQSLGSNLILVTPGAQRGPGQFVSGGRGNARTLTRDDAEAITSQIANVQAIAEEVSGRYQITARGTNTNTTVNGVTSSYPAIRNVSIDQGNFISDSQTQSMAKVAILGPTTVTDLFGDTAVAADAIGQTIRIKGMEFKVIGVTAAKGGSGFNNADDVVYIPVTSAMRFLSGNQYLTTIDIQATDASLMSQVQQDVTTLLLARHKISDSTQADFSVLNQSDILASASSITTTLTVLLGAISGISLLVGGIGIMNMMLTTVTERTKEIGLRKAIGAKNKDISTQFLAEAIALTVIGGIIGIILGVSISMFINSLGVVKTTVSPQAIALAFGVSAAIGIVFGYYPARKASRMNPIEALRYE